MTSEIKDINSDIIEEMAQIIWTAGYQLDLTDNGWAFDRAVHYLDLKDIVDKWTERHFDQFEKEWNQFVKEKSR